MSGSTDIMLGATCSCVFALRCSCVGPVKLWLLLLKAHNREAGIQKHKTVKIPAVDERKKNPFLLSKTNSKLNLFGDFFVLLCT